MNVLIIPDKLKGTLTAVKAAAAIANAWHRSRPQDVLAQLPMSDGGDGFGEVLGNLLHARRQTVKTVDAAHRLCTAHWWWEAKTKTSVLESAAVIGLAKLPSHKFHPFELDTFGLGSVLTTIAAKGARRCFLGIGGSATNDGGFGLARALGWEFLDRTNNAIGRWTDLFGLCIIRPPKSRIAFPELIVATDVQNPLLGPSGATRVYGPQKGLAKRDFRVAELCLQRLTRVVSRTIGHDFAGIPGAGAAGGLGFGLMAFAHARLEPGFELFARQAHLNELLRKAGLVLTAEGALDRSTLMGKGVGQLAKRCKLLGLPCIALAGTASSNRGVGRLFTQVHSLSELTTLEQAKANTATWLKRLTKQIAESWSHRLKAA